MRRWLIGLIIGIAVLVGILVLSQAASAEHQVLRLRDRQIITFKKMMDEVRSSQVVLVGEGHDNPRHHELELEIIRALKRDGADVAVGLEMFQYRSQEVLDQWSKGAMDEETFIPQYYANWEMPWSLYKDIFLYVRERRIPAIGLNVPLHISRKVASTGFNSLSPEELRQLPPGIACDLDPEYMAYVRKVHQAHKRFKERDFQFFCEAQVLWEQAMAWYIRKYREKHPETIIVVLTGLNHALKPGIPRQLARDGAPPSIAVIVPEITDSKHPTRDADNADYLVLFDSAHATP